VFFFCFSIGSFVCLFCHFFTSFVFSCLVFSCCLFFSCSCLLLPCSCRVFVVLSCLVVLCTLSNLYYVCSLLCCALFCAMLSCVLCALLSYALFCAWLSFVLLFFLCYALFTPFSLFLVKGNPSAVNVSLGTFRTRAYNSQVSLFFLLPSLFFFFCSVPLSAYVVLSGAFCFFVVFILSFVCCFVFCRLPSLLAAAVFFVCKRHGCRQNRRQNTKNKATDK
jgi:hypothetical protein